MKNEVALLSLNRSLIKATIPTTCMRNQRYKKKRRYDECSRENCKTFDHSKFSQARLRVNQNMSIIPIIILDIDLGDSDGRRLLAQEFLIKLENFEDLLLLGGWFSRYHPQTQLLRLVAVVGSLQQPLKSL
ncbi:hypothetical protein YC2023_023446 [Brassica napus]